MTIRASELPVERGPETGLARYFRVNATVSVRVGPHGVYACLTCVRTDCVHAEAADTFDRGPRVAGSAAA